MDYSPIWFLVAIFVIVMAALSIRSWLEEREKVRRDLNYLYHENWERKKKEREEAQEESVGEKALVVQCKFCGRENPSDASFCQKCGRKLQ
jgi:ribosomal protein L40E